MQLHIIKAEKSSYALGPGKKGLKCLIDLIKDKSIRQQVRNDRMNQQLMNISMSVKKDPKMWLLFKRHDSRWWGRDWCGLMLIIKVRTHYPVQTQTSLSFVSSDVFPLVLPRIHKVHTHPCLNGQNKHTSRSIPCLKVIIVGKLFWWDPNKDLLLLWKFLYMFSVSSDCGLESLSA